MHHNLPRTVPIPVPRSALLRALLAASLVVTACSAGQSSTNHHDDTSDNTAAKPAAGTNMPSFQQALAHFRKAAARRLNQPESQIEVVPGAENITGYPEFALGPFIAFDATAGRDMVRGMAEPGGKVVLGMNGQIDGLGHLLEAAHALDPARSLSAIDLAVRIVWMQGAEFFLVAAGHDTWKLGPKPPANLAEPTLTRAADGSAELRFFVNEAGDTGVIIGHEVVIRIAPGYQATMTMNRPAP
jgi:hypothetical protein